MTKFINCSGSNTSKKKTIFKQCVVYDYRIEEATRQPEDFKEVRHLGTDSNGHDLFLAIEPDLRLFYLGVKGNEFD